jgi:hypothetical protein
MGKVQEHGIRCIHQIKPLLAHIPDISNIHKSPRNKKKKRRPSFFSVADPDPNPDPYVYGPPGSAPDPLVRGIDPDPSITKQK